MTLFRQLHRLRWWVGAWFLLGMGAALASPLIQPRAMALVCTGAGSVSLVAHAGDGPPQPDARGMHCALCLMGSALPPPAAHTLPAVAVAPPDFSAFSRECPCGAMAVLPPARAPPCSFCQS